MRRGQKSMITIVQEYKNPLTTKEIYISDITDKFKKNMDIAHELITKDNDYSWAGECKPIKVENLKQLLDKVDTEYVEVFYHTDHWEYMIYPCDFRLATNEDINNEEVKALKEREDMLDKIIHNIHVWAQQEGVTIEEIIKVLMDKK